MNMRSKKLGSDEDLRKEALEEFCEITADLGRSLNMFWARLRKSRGKIEWQKYPKFLADTAHSSKHVSIELNKLFLGRRDFHQFLEKEKFRSLQKGEGYFVHTMSMPIEHPITRRPGWKKITNGFSISDVPFQKSSAGKKDGTAFWFDLIPWGGKSFLSAKEWIKQPVFEVRFPYGEQYEPFKLPPWDKTEYNRALTNMQKGEVKYVVRIFDLIQMMRNKLGAHSDDYRRDEKISDVLFFLTKKGPSPLRCYLHLLMLSMGHEAYRVAISVYEKEKQAATMPDLVKAIMPGVMNMEGSMPVPLGTEFPELYPPLVELSGIE